MFWKWTPQRWVAEDTPYHPHYDELDKVFLAVHHTKHVVYGALARALVASLRPAVLPSGLRALCQVAYLPYWFLALVSSKYGVIYFLSRGEAQSARRLIDGHEECLDAMGRFLAESSLARVIYNAAIEEYVQASHHAVRRGCRVIPPNCFMTADPMTVMARHEDFMGATDGQSDVDKYDLHDFAHASAAALCPDLYGAKFADGLPDLPTYATELIRSTGFECARGPAYGDRLLFSELLMSLFDAIDVKEAPATTKVDWMARALAQYLLADRALFHPSMKRWLRCRRAIRPAELAVLAQVKPYELTASEIEQHVFVRGGRADVLRELSTSDRIRTIGSPEFPLMYNERRNLYKHRAQARAYLYVCRCLRMSGRCSPLLEAVERSLTYQDYRDGRRQNLFRLVDGADLLTYFCEAQQQPVESAADGARDGELADGVLDSRAEERTCSPVIA
jgi:hypothetical protein